MDYLGIFITGFAVGFWVCFVSMQGLHKRIIKRGHMTVNDKIYDVTERK